MFFILRPWRQWEWGYSEAFPDSSHDLRGSARGLLPPVGTRDTFPVAQFGVGLILYSIGTLAIWEQIKASKIKCLIPNLVLSCFFLQTRSPQTHSSIPSFKEASTYYVILCYVILCHVMYMTCYVILCMDVWIDGWMDVNVNNRIEMFC